ncbi:MULTISPECIES: hypothetical protein [Enterococcus]|uniref:hypothetical protein n=1 Tax=Enterococcus TaxID=1350 RepID=UPI0007C174AB|nr:hypothetical protein [Enterococcus hirae]AND72116.1 hypothetical protein A6P53_04345 [Enterococcus hirae]
MEKNEGLFNVYFKADRVDYGKNGYESINLKNNPSLMSDSIYLYNLLFMNKPAFVPRDWEQHQVNFERYVMPRLTVNEQAIVREWINTLHKNELLQYRSLEGMAKTYVTFHKLLKKITNEADQAFEDQFKDVQSLDQQSRKKTIDIYSFYHKISNEKTAESTKRLEAQVSDLLIKPVVNKGENSPNWFNDLVRAVMVLERGIESEKLKTKIFTEIKKSGNQPVLEEKWDSFIKNHAIPRMQKNNGLDKVYYELSQTINVLNKKIKVSVEEAQSVSSVFYNKIFPNLLRLPDMSHLEKIAIYEIYIDESNLLPKTKNKIKKTLEKNLLKKEKKKLEEVKLLKKQNIQMIEEVGPHDLLALEEIQRGKQKATVDFFTAIYKKYGALNRTTMTREKYLSEEVQRGKQKATGDLFTVIYEKNGALNRTAISREAKKYLSKVGYLEFEFIVHNSEQKNHIIKQESTSLSVLKSMLKRKDLSPYAVKAYCLAYLEERQLESNIKKLWRKPFLKDLTPEEIKVVENLVSEKRLCLQLGKEVGPELAVRYERSNQDNQVERLKLFNEMDQKVFSVTCRQFIKEQAKKCLSATNYTRFEVAQMIRNIERKKGLQEREKNNFFDSIINSQDLSSNEIRAYCLAYLEEQQMESNIKKNLRKPFLKELKPEEILKVKNLVSEKRLYLQLGKEVGPELATKLDNSKESDQVVLSQLFKEMDQKAFSVTCRQFIKEQAKKHLSEENYVRFEIGHVIREGESKKNLQEWEETDFLNPFLSRENLSPNEIRAYEIAYLEMKYEPFSQMNSWKKSLQQYFEKNLASEERNEVQALVPQKRVLIQLSKELDLKNVFQLEEIQQGKQEGRLGFFTDIYEKSFSTTNQEYIKTQAKIYLSPANHAEFAVKSQMQDALREKGLKLANIKFSEDKIRVFLDQKTQSPLEIRAYYLACIEEQVIPMDIKKSLIHALKKVLTVDENLKLSELISEQQRLIHLSEEIGPERTLEFLKIKKENKAATIDFFTDLYNNVSSYTQQWIKEQASLHLNRKEHLEFTKKVKLKEIIKEGGPDLKASAVYNQRKRAFEKAMSLPVIEELQVKNGLQQVNANLLDPLELRRLNKEQLIDSLVKVQVRFPHWEQRLKDQAIDRSISHLNDLEKKEIKTSLKVEELKGFLNKVKFHDSDGFSLIWGYAKFHVDNDRRIIKLQKIKEQLDEIAPANLLQPVVVKILTNNKCDYQDLKLREAIVSYDKTAIEINHQLKSEFKAMGVTFKEVSRNQILRRIFKNLDKGLKSEKEQIAEVLSDSNLHYNNLLNTLLVQFEKKVHEYIPYLDTLIQKDYEDKGDVSLTNKRILELVENEPGLKDLLVCCQNMLPSYPLKNYAQTIPMVSTYFANLAHQIEETYQSPGKKLAKQIFMLGKLDPLYCAKMIQYLSAQYTNKQPNPLPIHPNILIQNKMEKIVESYHDLYPLPSLRSELTGKKVVNKVANEVVGNVERPISISIIEQSSQPFDWNPFVILNQEVRPTETAKAIVAFHNKYHDLEMTKQFTAFATKPRLEREKDKTNTTKEESLKEVAYQEFLKKKKSYKKSKNSAGREIAHKEMELALKKYQHIVQKKQDQKECANNMENQELVRAGVYLTQQLQSDELTNYLVERMIAPETSSPENRRPANVQLQYFIKELVHDLNTATEREAAIQTIMQPYLSVEERQKFYAFMKQDTYLQQFLKQENLSKIELKACVSACLHKSDLPFKEQVDQKLDVFLTDKEQRQLKEMVSQKEIVRVLAEQRDYETAVKFEKVLKKEEVGEINWLVSIYNDTPFLLIKESITSLIDSSFNEADRMQFYNKINSNHKLKDLSKQVSLTTAEGENSRSNKEDMFSLVSAISPEVAERIEATNLKRLPLITEIKANLEEKGIKYYLPEIIKEIGKIDWNNHQGNSENELIKEKLRQVSITCSDEQIENWKDIFFDNFIEGIRIGDLNEQKEIYPLSGMGVTFNTTIEKINELLKIKYEKQLNQVESPSMKKSLDEAKENLIEEIEQSVRMINPNDKKRTIEDQFVENFTHCRIQKYGGKGLQVKNILEESPTLKKVLLKKLPTINLSYPIELRKLINEWYENTPFSPFLKEYYETEQERIQVEKSIYKLFYNDDNYCAENMRVMLVDYAGISVSLDPRDREMYGYPLRKKAESVLVGYKEVMKKQGISKILPKELQELQKNIPGQKKSTMISFDFITQNDQSVKGNQRTQVSMQQIMEKAGNCSTNSPLVSERTHGTSINRGESTNERSMPNDRQLSEKLSYNR